MEIEERAQKFADSYPDSFPVFAYYAAKNGYRTGATEQREIDKKEFASKLRNACLSVESKYNMNTFGFLYDRIVEAMKGEEK